MQQRHLMRRCERGFGLIELMLTIAVMAVLSAIAIPTYNAYIDRNKVSVAVTDIAEMELVIANFDSLNARLPTSLAEVQRDGKVDPWGNLYQYLDFTDDTKGARKDGKLKPLNTDYDLYSMGKDGQSKTALTDNLSLDDVIRANDGTYLGKAENY